ncbi:hypothetical protein AMAG_03282 [Allomyces macrogynus ATCC 38327]|uniref:Uncharacterized protein n=1 Tax=Allomyces macrogynus (strain ATCC 38327) TaxID=578462 RepID=A0A0L0S4Z8_ALLM3|nr:hypothetical protein AMAG_03282 [Allomyces macrogynus ATCC 38327]|eukprot:KNE57592.1 hypothetical protein AMAG_03282 [Allomyces macrogynus ATCC 38327]
MIGAPNNSRGGVGGSCDNTGSSNGAGASSTPPTSAAATVRAHRTSTTTIRSSASSSYRAAAHQQYLQQATYHNVYRPVPPNAPQKPHPHHQHQASTISAASSNFPSPPTGGAQYATGSVPARVAVPPAFAAAAAAARHAAAHGIGPRPAASTTRLRTDHHHRHSASDPTGSGNHHGPSASVEPGHGSSSSSSTLLPSVFFQSAAFPGNYALVRTSESRCEFLPVVPSAPSKAVLAASKRAAARARRRITLIKPSKHSLRGRPAVLMAAETAEEAAAAEEEAEDELASLPGDKRDNGGDEGENDPHHADEPSDEEQDLDDEAAAEPEPVPRHPWGSEFLLLEYRRGAKPAPVTRETVKNGLPVLICARHGLMGLRRDLAEAEGRPASLIDEEAGKASADALAPQFIGFKDSGTLFTIQYPTSKTLFTIESVSNQGFSLRTDAGQYLCVSERHLSTTLSPTNNACTFRFIFVKNPRDPFGHAAAGRPIASSSSRPVSTTTSIGVPLTSRRAVSMIAPGTGTLNSAAANTPTTPAGYSMRTPTSAADSAAGSFARMSLNGSVVVPPPMRNHARHHQTSSSYYTPPAAMAAAEMMTPPRHSQVAPPAPGPHAAMMTNRVSGEIAMTVTGPVPALSRSMGGGGNAAPPMPSVPKEWLTGPAGPPPLPPLPGAGAASGKNNLLTKVAYRVAIQDSKSRVLICDPLVKPRRMTNLRGGGNDHQHHHHYDEVASHRSRSSGSSRGSRSDPYVLRLASVKDHSDSRILFFHVLVLPEGHLDDTSSVRTHDSNASIRADTSSAAASRLDEQLKYASALDLLDPAPKRVMFRSSDGRYLAVRMPAGYHQSRPRRPGSGPQVLANHHPGGSMHIKPASVQVLGSDDEDDDDTTAASDDELEGIGSLVLTSRPTAAGVWRYTQLPHSPLSFSLQSNVLRTYLSVHTPGPVAALPAKSVLSRALAGMGRSASPANNAAAASTTTLQATATAVGVREALTLFVPPTLQQAIALQAARGPPRNATYLAMAITGASLMGATAGIVNMVINANRPVNNSASSAAHADSAAAGAHGGGAAAPTGTTVTNGTTTATSAAAADAAAHHTVATTATVATPYGAVDASVHPGDTVSNVHVDSALDAAANHDATASASASISAPHPFDGLSGPSVSDIANSHPHDLWSSQPMPGSSSAAAHHADVDSAAMLPPAHADVDTVHYYSVADLNAAGSEMHYMDAHQYNHDPSMYDTMHHDQYNPASSVHF